MPRYLVTTSDERTWRSDCPILFLGEWCRLYERRATWEKLDAEVAPYHWDDRKKFKRDYQYLKAIYEVLLERVGGALNDVHGVSHSPRYWRILIGPWLYAFIDAVFDRWEMIDQAIQRYSISGTSIVAYPESAMIPMELRGLAPQSTHWNQFIYGLIIKRRQKLPYSELNPGSDELTGICPAQSSGAPSARFTEHLGKRIMGWLNKVQRPNEAMIIGSYLPRISDLKLQMALGQVPKRWRSPSPPQAMPDMVLRDNIRLDDRDLDDFGVFLCTIIFKQCPVAYLESYQQMAKVASAVSWPARPSLIFTSNNYNFDEVFKTWVAAQVETGVPLVIGQHGGHMGAGGFNQSEEHQNAIANRFLTWGWNDSRPTVYPALALTVVGKRDFRMKKDGGVMLVTSPVGRYSYKLSSSPIGANQSSRFLQDQLRFSEMLPDEIRCSLTVRVDKGVDDRLGTPYVRRWKEAFPNVKLDYSTEPIETKIKRCRLIVNTYNSTGFLETLARNAPTIIFWRPDFFELRPDAEKYFMRLKDVGIYHESPESAAKKVTEVWGDVGAWWLSAETQQARRYFCDQYARSSKQPIRVLKQALMGAVQDL